MLYVYVYINTTNTREEKGKEIASKNDLHRLDRNTYRVRSQTTSRVYDVVRAENGWICTCPDHKFRKVCCKHIHAVEWTLKFRDEVKTRVIKPISDSSICIYCKSNKVTKDGLRHNKYGDIQKYYCKDCKKYFTINIGFEKMKHDPRGITTAMQLYFSGESLRNVARSLRLLGMDVTHQTVYNWIKKYTKLMQKYLDGITPHVSDTWRADEIFVKIRGNQKYLFALMDDETRFWIAQEVGDTKHTHIPSKMFRDGKTFTQTKPRVLITDGLQTYQKAFRKEFWAQPLEKRTIHIRTIRFQGDMNNNKMERLNGEIRDREKVMRGLKKKDSVIIDGYQLFHNYIRPHMGLDGKTPAEACGIKIEGENKWMTLIQNASRK